jgi:hypothetical protein
VGELVKTLRPVFPLLAISTFLAPTGFAAPGWQPLGAVNAVQTQKGQFLRVPYTCHISADSLRVKISATDGSFSPWWKMIEISAFGVSRSPHEVLLGGKVFSNWKYADAEKALRVTIPQLERGQEIIVNY